MKLFVCAALDTLKLYATTIGYALMLVVTAALLSGCLATPQVVVKTQVRYQAVPSELTTPVKPQPPIDKVSYLAMPVYEREAYLANYSVDLMKGLYSCNAQLGAISTLSTKWKALGHEDQP